MQSQWLRKDNSSSLVIFFTGWGMKPASTSHLKITNHDMLVFFDYRNLQSDEMYKLSNYRDIIVVAWSMGIMAASFVIQEAAFNPTLSIAINGTGTPVSDLYGISVEIYTATINALGENSLKKFLLRMCGSKVCFDRFMENHLPSDIEDLKQELIAIEKHQHDLHTDQKWDYAILGQNDSIFPCSNMNDYWKDKAHKVISINASHFPFFNWDSWKNIIGFCKENN